MIKFEKIKDLKLYKKYRKLKFNINNSINLIKKNAYIYILAIVKINKNKYKIIYIKNFLIDEDIYRGFFINEQIINSSLDSINLAKWYFVEEDYNGNILYLFNEKEQINLQNDTL